MGDSRVFFGWVVGWVVANVCRGVCGKGAQGYAGFRICGCSAVAKLCMNSYVFMFCIDPDSPP